MEVLLNTIWMAIAVAAFAAWRPHRCVHRGRTSLVDVVALACALLLLFPVISLTDDLHAEQYPMEDCARSVMKVRNLQQGCLHAGRSLFIKATKWAACAASLNVVLGKVIPLEIPPFAVGLASACQGRSPPHTA